jgi:hypothetical protein
MGRPLAVAGRMIVRVAPVLGVMMLLSCAATSPGPSSLGAPGVLPDDAMGILVGRTYAPLAPVPFTPLKGEGPGLTFWVRNLETGAVYATAKSLWGYTASQYFSLQLPPGHYVINSIFAHDGQIMPLPGQEDHIEVLPGIVSYAGSVVIGFQMPKDVRSFGPPVSVKHYGFMHCPILSIFSCNGDSTNGEAGDPRTDVYVFNRPGDIAELKKVYPAIAERKIQTNVFH